MLDNNNASKKPLVFYVTIAMVIVYLLNAFVMPMLLAKQVQELGYSDFLQLVDKGRVTEVSLDQTNDQIVFIAKDDADQEQIYKTAVFPDDGLRERLEKAGVKFSAQIPTQNSPLVGLLVGWIIPIALFWGLGSLLSRQMGKRLGGGMNAMSFGKANAKIVAEKETGVTFADVAGEEEAKDALKEIVDFLEHPS